MRSRRVGVSTFFRLMREYGSAAAALEALPEVARAAGVDKYTPCPPEVAEAEFRAGRLAGATMICFGDPAYPARLTDLSDPPPILWALGDAGLLDRPAVALVGARNASSLGTRIARRLAEELGAKGFVIVSGLARGVDAAAHTGALGGGTIAVMAGGVDVVYPVENAVLAQEIEARGLRLSEQPMGLQPQARHFPRRNRLISGLARAVVVAEAAAKSGSLLTARDAADQGRDVLAVPGHPFDARAAGCNLLIRDGATLVRGTEDVIEALGPLPHPQEQAEMPLIEEEPPRASAATPPSEDEKTGKKKPRKKEEIAALHRQILDRLGPSPLAEDQLIRDLGLAAGDVTPQLVTLEIEGRIERQPGGLLTRLH
ncbi:DNA-processing protein DprA [Tranquillimonas alkanivorans]|uniref:DNA-processing protein DprA n=1 Tax=Tranquillimonas alkanivorans TaxID=441119 RepID=UPI000B86A83A|nr:DNA-processing protein DprA [Tranquillimonas alkanivorans]